MLSLCFFAAFCFVVYHETRCDMLLLFRLCDVFFAELLLVWQERMRSRERLLLKCVVDFFSFPSLALPLGGYNTFPRSSQIYFVRFSCSHLGQKIRFFCFINFESKRFLTLNINFLLSRLRFLQILSRHRPIPHRV